MCVLDAAAMTSSDLSALIPAPDLAAWVAGTGSLADVAPRRDDPQARAQGQADFDAIIRHEHGATILSVLRAYVRTTIPCPRATEQQWWTVTGPSDHPAAVATYGRLAAITVGPTQTLVLSETTLGGHSEPGGFLLVDRATVESRVGPVSDLEREVAGVWARSWVPDVSEDAVAVLGFYEWGGIWSLLQTPAVVMAARRLNVDLMEQGTSRRPERHVPDLADRLVAIMPGDPPRSPLPTSS